MTAASLMYNNMLLQNSLGLTPDKSGKNPDIVIGGPCICFSQGEADKLSLQDIIDSAMPAISASFYNVPCYLYFQSYESDLMANLFHYTPENANFLTMKNNVLIGLKLLLSKLNISIPEIIIVDTNEPAITKAIDQLVINYANYLQHNSLFGLYASGDSQYPKAMPEEALLLSVYQRNVMLYTTDFFKIVFGLNDSCSRLYVQNLTQRKAIAYMKKQSINEQSTAYFYAPPLNKLSREMNLGGENLKIALNTTQEKIQDLSKSFFEQDFSGNILYKLLFPKRNIDEFMLEFKKLCVV